VLIVLFHGIDCNGFPEDENPFIGVGGSSSLLAPGSIQGNLDTLDIRGQQMVGQAMVRTGAAILMVPDPLPLVDEVVGGALVVGGAVLTFTA
jgi:hypothetical protein